jgi:hypothetical protein
MIIYRNPTSSPFRSRLLTISAIVCALVSLHIEASRADTASPIYPKVGDASLSRLRNDGPQVSVWADDEKKFKQEYNEGLFPALLQKFPYRSHSGKQIEFGYSPDNDGLVALNPYCNRFVEKDGSYGPYGKLIAAYLMKKYKADPNTPMLADDLVGMKTEPLICPRWDSLGSNRDAEVARRIKFWVWTMASVASLESKCGLDPDAMKGMKGMSLGHGKHRTAIGLFQMVKQKVYRPTTSIPTCNVADGEIGKSYYNILCAVDTMERQIREIPKSSGENGKLAWPIYRSDAQFAKTEEARKYCTQNGGSVQSEAAKEFCAETAKPRSYWLSFIKPWGGYAGHLIRTFEPCEAPHS